jgi:hypothetical protein
MPTLSAARALILASSAILLPAVAHAQDADHDWTKTYTVADHPSLTLATGDTGVEIASCGTCQTLHIAVHTDRKLSDYTLEEHQDQNHVFFTLKEHPTIGVHITWHTSGHQGTRVTIETPASLGLDAQLSDGGFSAHGLNGEFQIRSADGGISLDDVRGTFNLKTSDGHLAVHHASGQIEGRTSDGSMDVDGQFSKVLLHTSDGSVTFALAEGSALTAPSRIESSDGSVRIRLPQNLAANLELSASDGHVHCALPLALDGYDSKGSGHHIAGRLNAGGTPLTVHTSDGSVTVDAL